MTRSVGWIVACLLLAGCTGGMDEDRTPEGTTPLTSTPPRATTPATTPAPEGPSADAWTLRDLVVPGGRFADPEVAPNPAGGWRLYYQNVTHDAEGRLELHSHVSADGHTWTYEGEVRERTSFPDVVPLDDGRLRMYFTTRADAIQSATSQDGLRWTDEAGERIRVGPEDGPDLAAPTVIRHDGQWMMVYRSTQRERYDADVPNDISSRLHWATSPDGLTWTKQGVALDPRNAVLRGWADGPELVAMDGELRLYFWGYEGIYSSAWNGSAFPTPERPELACVRDPPDRAWCQHPPSDPTVANLDGAWTLFFGSMATGIHAATREG